MASRVHKSLINAKVNLLFYFLSLFFGFYSRKIFLEYLSSDFIGLTGTLGNILGYLNLAELGIGTSISFFLYKPLQSDNREKIIELLSVFGYLYHIIGYVILAGGFVTSLFFPLIFKNNILGFPIIYFTFYCYLASCLIGYFINYRQILLTADQKNYIVSAYFQTACLVKIALQLFLAYKIHNLFLFISVEFIFGLLGCIILNRAINKQYPWLQTNIFKGGHLLKKYPEILKNTRLVFLHNIKDFLLNKSDELFVFIFVSLKMVAYYGNYTMIVGKISLLFKVVLDSVSAGVGNLVAEGDKQKMMSVFWELSAIRHFISGILCVGIYFLLESFINIWLGPQYILNHTILVLMVINIYIVNSRGVVDNFNHAYGLYADVWSVWVELILNITVTIVAGYYWGIIGCLLGKLASYSGIVIFWKPYYLFNAGFKEKYSCYWKKAIRYYIIFGLCFLICLALKHIIYINPYGGYLKWILYSIIIMSAFIIIYIPLLYYFAPGSKELSKRLFILFSNWRKR